MRELRTCDFCGSDAVGVFEVLPPELTPADDQRRVVLCEHCQATLTDVIEPLLTRLGVVDADVDVPNDAAAASKASGATSGAESGGGPASVDVDAVDPAPSPPEPADHDSPDDPVDPLDESPQADGSQQADDDEREDAATGVDTEETDAETGQRTDAEAGETDAPAASESGESGESDDSDDDDGPTEPPKFRKVVRILQNREFPVERAAVEALASNAYDLDDDEVADIFDYAVERGLLVDDGGTLRKP